MSALVDLGGEAEIVKAARGRRTPCVRGICEGRMTNEGWSVLLGTAAGFCTTISFVPQIIKIWKQGGRDVSYGMLTLFLVGVLLWFVYGLVVKAQAVIITNLATAVLIAIAMGMKAYTAKRDFGKEVMGDVGVGD
jgi:MtN3 and saliva related transmembrane protein